MSLFTAVGILLAVATVYRICKTCWRSTAHDVLIDEDGGYKLYRCRECGASFREEIE